MWILWVIIGLVWFWLCDYVEREEKWQRDYEDYVQRTKPFYD